MPYRFDIVITAPGYHQFNPPSRRNEQNVPIADEELNAGALSDETEAYLASARLHTEKPFDQLSDVLGVMMGPYYCSTRLRAIIEQFAGDHVQWRSIDVVGNGFKSDGVTFHDDAEVHRNSYHALICTTLLDCVDETKGDIRRGVDEFTNATYVYNQPDDNWIIKADVVAGHHLWCGSGEFIGFWFMSEALHDALKAAKITGFEFDHCPLDTESAVADAMAAR